MKETRTTTSEPATLTRREALKVSGVAAGAAALGTSGGKSPTSESRGNGEPSAYKGPPKDEPLPDGDDFLSRWRKRWTWDYTVRSTHFNNCAYQAHCAFEVYVRNGRVIREEQAATYTTRQRGMPDANPRGCQKGCGYSELMQGPVRLTRPLKRKGARGSGEWQEISWEQAIGEIADKVVDVLAREGSNSIAMDLGTNALIGLAAFGAGMQFADATDCVVLDLNTGLGDDEQGATVTYGSIFAARSLEEYFHSDLLICWSGNPAYTQIPNFHFLAEARYRGTRLVVISPDYNATAMHADFWVPVRPGTDAALALALAREVIERKWHDESLLREQTDLPILVRTDNRRFLRESDLKRNGSTEQLYCWDERRNRLQAISTETLKLEGLQPALEGRFEVRTLDGTVEVEPAFERLKAHIAPYTPEAASELCGTPAPVIRELARMLGEARAASNVGSYALGKYHHGDAMMRSQILAFVLAGHLGRKGAGWVTAVADIPPDALGATLGKRRNRKATAKLNRRQWYELLRDHANGQPASRSVARGLSEGWVDAKVAANATLFWNIHGGVSEVSNQPWDPSLPRPPGDYINEALSKGWQGLEPPRDHTPKIFFEVAGNALRRVRAAHKLREVLWPKLELVVVTDVRMSTTAREADYFLPVAGFYEKPNVGFFSGNMLNAYAATPVVPALGESKDEWQIYWMLASEIQKRAQELGLASFTDRHGEARRFEDCLNTYTLDGTLGRADLEKLCKRVIEESTNLGGVSWEEISRRGYAPVTSLGRGINDSATSWSPEETVTPYLWHTRDKLPWPTLSGRVQFYIDHPWYLELGEELPAYKESPKAGGDYPLMMNSGHGRWSIHSLNRTDPLMLRLQRGEPCLYVSVEDARERGINDWDRVEVFNDVGRFQVRVKISPAIRPGMVMIYHAWEDYQHEGGAGHRVVMASPINPLELAGGQPYLTAMSGMRQPGMSDRDTRVEIRRL